MIITCPSCAARYAVDRNSVGSEGRRVKCTKCDHHWYHTPLPGNDSPVYRTPGLPDSLGVMETTRPGTRQSQRGLYGWLAFVVILAGLVFAVVWWKDEVVATVPATGKIYELAAPVADGLREILGIPRPEQQLTKILALTNVKHKYVHNAGGRTAPRVLSVTGDLANLTDQPVQLPEITILLYDDADTRIGLWQFPPPAKTLGPRESIQFWSRFVPPADFATVRAGVGVARMISERVPTS